jgi:hypothetical protein
MSLAASLNSSRCSRFHQFDPIAGTAPRAEEAAGAVLVVEAEAILAAADRARAVLVLQRLGRHADRGEDTDPAVTGTLPERLTLHHVIILPCLDWLLALGYPLRGR